MIVAPSIGSSIQFIQVYIEEIFDGKFKFISVDPSGKAIISKKQSHEIDKIFLEDRN